MGTKVLTQNKSSCWSYFIRLNEGSTRTYTKKIEKNGIRSSLNLLETSDLTCLFPVLDLTRF